MSKESIKGITVNINGDASGLKTELDSLNEKAEKFVSLLREADGILQSMTKGRQQNAR